MAKKGVDFDPDFRRVFEICNPHQAKKALEAALEAIMAEAAC